MAALSSHIDDVLSDKVNVAGFITGSVSADTGFKHLTDLTLPGRPLLHYILGSTLLIPLIFPLYRFVLNDYQAFLALGPGGTPSTFNGYLWVTFLKIFFARSDTCVPPTLIPYEFPIKSYLQLLPQRSGTRPRVAGIAPHRQITQRGSNETLHSVALALRKLTASNADLLALGTSCFEKHTLALFFSPRPAQVQPSATNFIDVLPLTPDTSCCENVNKLNSLDFQKKAWELATDPLNVVGLRDAICSHPGEIAHLHNVDGGSMHLTLHPLDAAVVISNGWGERHPLAGRGSWVPNGFIMVYAPRTTEEIEVVMEIVRAASWWIGGCALKSRAEEQAGGA